MLPHNTLELAFQEFDIVPLEEMDAMDWGSSFATSLAASITASTALSISVAT